MTFLSRASEALRGSDAEAWLVYSFRGSNPVFGQLVGTRLVLTRRAFILVKPGETPKLLVSRVDGRAAITSLEGFDVGYYLSWHELSAWLGDHLAGLSTVAMEYSPMGELPAMSWVDGGTLDLVRDTGVTVTSSAELLQHSAASWSEESRASHDRAMRHVVEIKDDAFAEIQRLLSEGLACDEYVIQKRITDAFADRGLITDDAPVVAVNANSGNPHYEPTSDRHDPITVGDWVLIDLWAKEQGPEAIFADITWVGYVGSDVPQDHGEVFAIVAAARDAVVAHLHEHRASRGYELDRVARKLIADAGYGEQFAHRTGHSLSPGDSVHGLGANLDDLETHDTRIVQAGLGFTIEPGIYLPRFGVRSEINVFMSDGGPVVTSPTQTRPVLMTVN